MSSQLKEKSEEKSENNYFSGKKLNISAVDNSKVNLNDLVSRLNTEKKKERNQNIILSVAAVSVVTVFGVILAL
tara:strand:- start:478 stop:699 length:222 start_codon:yes stop_codon:yes gene_type:complete